MKAILTVLVAVLLSGCASTYHLSENERSRSYSGDFEDVWLAALEAVDQADLAIVEAEPEHGKIVARSGWTIWDIKGHVIVIVVSDTVEGHIRVDANAEAYSEETVVDFGKSGRMVKKFLREMDSQMRQSTP